MPDTIQPRYILLLILPFLIGGCASAESNRDYQQTDAQGEGRRIYSPNIKSDPYVQRQWEASVRALEIQCAQQQQYCAEASKGRDAIQKLPQAR
jgi:hypothetical protein